MIYKIRVENEEVYKVYLLQDQGIRSLSYSRLCAYLQRKISSENIEKEWESTCSCIHKTGFEVLYETRKLWNKRGLKTWNKEIAASIGEKKRAYNVHRDEHE